MGGSGNPANGEWEEAGIPRTAERAAAVLVGAVRRGPVPCARRGGGAREYSPGSTLPRPTCAGSSSAAPSRAAASARGPDWVAHARSRARTDADTHKHMHTLAVHAHGHTQDRLAQRKQTNEQTNKQTNGHERAHLEVREHRDRVRADRQPAQWESPSESRAVPIVGHSLRLPRGPIEYP
jgi:hypothetical protein